jgi:hypothetical protein
MSVETPFGTSTFKESRPPLPWLIGGGIALAVLGSTVLGKLFVKKSRLKNHDHPALVHSHDHVHVTHNRTDTKQMVGGWEHLSATHSHEHNHAPMTHTHRPHRNFDAEHATEAHVHDHEHPSRS